MDTADIATPKSSQAEQRTGASEVDIIKQSPGNTIPILKRVTETIERYGMLVPGDRLLIGVSGGADSVALLHMLIALKPIFKLELAVAHLNHGLRSHASDRDAQFVAKLSDRLGVRCHCHKVTLDQQQGSLEERARSARYAYFDRLMGQYDYTRLALGHQADDNAEAVLLHILRGSGIRGLSGIPPKRDHIVRPLMEVSRAEINGYLELNSISHVEDASNQDQKFQRNRIRHHLIPLLKSNYNPNMSHTLNRMANLCRDEQTWLSSLLQPHLDSALLESGPTLLELKTDILLKLPRAAQRRLIRMAMRGWMGNIRRLGLDHIDAALELLNRHDTGRRLSLPQKVTVERTAHSLRFLMSSAMPNAASPVPTKFQYPVPLPQDRALSINVPEAGCRLAISIVAPAMDQKEMANATDVAWFDLKLLKFPLIIRNFESGDRLAPFGMPGTQKVKKLFIDRKIPRKQRPYIPILAQGDDILWVAGLRRSATAPISERTKQALRIELLYAAKPDTWTD